VEGAGHNDLPEVAGQAYWNALRDFLPLCAVAQSTCGIGEPPKPMMAELSRVKWTESHEGRTDF